MYNTHGWYYNTNTKGKRNISIIIKHILQYNIEVYIL